MMESGLFHKHFVGRDGFIWWIGQVASDSWKENIVGSTNQTTQEYVSSQPGFGYRYQVRIMGYHTADDNLLPRDQLPWASVMYPITAGGGGGNYWTTPNIRMGNFVYGFFMDGEDAQQPVIMGILAYNQYQELKKENPNLPGFTPFLGVPNKGPGSTISVYGASIETEGKGEDKDLVIGNPKSNQDLASGQNGLEQSDARKYTKIEHSKECGNSKSPAGIQKDIQNMIKSIQDAQKWLKSAKRVALNKLQVDGIKVTIDDFTNNEMTKATEAVSGFMKDMVTEMEKFKTDTILKNVQGKLDNLLPAEMAETKKKVDTAMDLVGCLFRKIIGNLKGMIMNALKSILDRYINAPLCAMENIVGSILGKLTGFVDSAINKLMKPLQAALGIVDIAGDALSFVTGVLSFISCDEKPACASSQGFSLWDGAEPTATFDPLSLINKVKDFAGRMSKVMDPDNFNFDLDMNFNDLWGDAVAECNVGPIFCGPPKVEFFGGSGSGAQGNAIINAAGYLLGVDIISTGSGYKDKAPIIRFIDDCGNGEGAEGEAEIGPVCLQPDGTYQPCAESDIYGVTDIIISSPGTGYLRVPDGSQGGDGRVWAPANATTVRKGKNGPRGVEDDQRWDVPFDPGDMITVFAGDVIRTPINSESEIVTTLDGGIVTTTPIPPGIEFEVPESGEVTAPVSSDTAPPQGDYPIKNLQYPVIMYLCDAIITNGGFGYQEGDKVVIEPSYGAEIVPTFGPGGDLVNIKIVSGGEGIKELPNIYIQSETGFNADILPKFCIDRVTDELKLPEIQDKVVSVVDCVGKV